MTITTACLLNGNPGYELVAQAVEALLRVRVEIEQPMADDDAFFILNFPDPEESNYSRRMSVFLRNKEPSVSPEFVTRCSFYGEGRVTEILAALALHFGGWISIDTGTDDWTMAKRVVPPACVELSSLDELNLALSKILPSAVAIELRKVVSDDGRFDELMEALDRYRDRSASTDVLARLEPLEWRQFSDRGDQETTTIVGVYKVRPSSSERGRFRLYAPGAIAEDAPFHPDAESAKLAAWRHYRKLMASVFA
jgi:hypothetical protein